MQLAVCAEMVFLDLPVTERVRRIAEAGFDAEIWDWTRHDIDALAATGAWAADGDTDRALTRSGPPSPRRRPFPRRRGKAQGRRVPGLVGRDGP